MPVVGAEAQVKRLVALHGELGAARESTSATSSAGSGSAMSGRSADRSRPTVRGSPSASCSKFETSDVWEDLSVYERVHQ